MKQKAKEGKAFLDRVDGRVWVLISLLLAVACWQLVSMTKAGGAVFAAPAEVLKTLWKYTLNGKLWANTSVSVFRVISGFLIALAVSIPVAFLMGWYKVVRHLVEPWIQFIRCIPPIAYIPLVIVAQGIGEKAKVTVIFISTFLVMVVTIYQGVLNVDNTLIKAGKVLGANDRDVFFKIVVPASLPFILTAIRLGLSTGLTTLIAAEMTGASSGLGTMIQEASLYFQMNVVLMGILVIGIIGLILEKFVKFLERRLTGWQETRVV